MILENGVIRTMDSNVPLQAALAVAGERIAGAIGTHETALATPDVVDLGGRCVLPGFTDAHVHFPTWALARRQIRLEGATSLEEVLERIRNADAVAPGTWISAHGWRDGDWMPRVAPTRQALDSVTGDVPAALLSHDYHSLWLNTAALGVASGDLEVPGGVVERADDGLPTGVLREEAAWRFKDRHIAVSDDEYVDAMREGLRVAAARGVTAIHDKDGWLGAPRLWQRLHEQRGLTLRVWQSVPHEQLDRLREIGVTSGIGDDYLRIGYLKAFMDGTLGSQTAHMLDGSGVEITSGAELAEIVSRAAAAGWPVAVHAIGDRANRDALDAFEATSDLWRAKRLRQRIEHAQCLDPVDAPRFASLGVSASMQFSHATSDRDLAERFWPDRLDGTYAFRSLVDSGAVVANGSDAPVEELDPWTGVCAGVLRTTDDRPAWRPGQAVTVDQALAATIVAPAWLSGDERRRGKLLPGFLADLVVLDRDPLACPVDELADTCVVATMVGGRWVHNPPPWE
jgi:predicted amidohydrolase YtcJ